MLKKGATLEEIAARVAKEKIDPKPRSGRQEFYENLLTVICEARRQGRYTGT